MVHVRKLGASIEKFRFNSCSNLSGIADWVGWIAVQRTAR
jgi:hypothetical protein